MAARGWGVVLVWVFRCAVRVRLALGVSSRWFALVERCFLYTAAFLTSGESCPLMSLL